MGVGVPLFPAKVAGTVERLSLAGVAVVVGALIGVAHFKGK